MNLLNQKDIKFVLVVNKLDKINNNCLLFLCCVVLCCVFFFFFPPNRSVGINAYPSAEI